MNGLNKSFMTDPRGFLQKHCVTIPFDPKNRLADGSTASKVPVPGVHNFDLYFDGQYDCVFLRHVKDRTKWTSPSTNLIRAYWLPWMSKKTTILELKDEADYFFTSALAGCRIQVAGNVVAHIAGDSSDFMGKGTGSDWRQKEADAFEKAVGSNDSLRFSSSADYGTKKRSDGIAFFLGYKALGAWTFLGQRHTVDHKTGKYSIKAATTRTHGGKLWDSIYQVDDNGSEKAESSDSSLEF